MKPEIYLGTLKKTIPVGRLTKSKILKTICKEFEMDFEEVKNRKTRKRQFVYVRHLYAYFCRKYTNESFRVIGEFIKKDHATIMHSNTTIENWRETEENVKVLTNILHKKFNSQIVNFKEDEMEEIGNNIILKYAN
jgi:chromosomal replication initiation ATPase DnaA